MLPARSVVRRCVQGHQSRRLGRAESEGAGTGQGQRRSQAVPGHTRRTVEHLHRVVYSLCRAAHNAQPGH
eukprot:1648851-Alexandrium_andersonii.AAC.1